MRTHARHGVRRALRGSSDQNVAHGPEPRRMLYERLARVSVRHGYYDSTGGACADFAVRPTAHTAALMARLGLLFREEADGFSVLYDVPRKDQLLAYLNRDRDPRTNQPWTRLCFLMALKNPWFVNFTALPIDTNPARRNFYLTNRQAHPGENGTMILPPRRRVTGLQSVPVTGGQFVEAVGPEVKCVRVLAVSGEEVLCKPRCVTLEAARTKTPNRFDCRDIAPDGEGVCSERLFFDLTGLPEEKYMVQTVQVDGRTTQGEYLYTASSPIPLCFVELLFSDPAGGDGGGRYPVRDLGADDQRIEGVAYEIPFAARRTWWSYYVVAEPPAGETGMPRIQQVREGEGALAPRVHFSGPCRVRLDGGRAAWRFVSSRPIRLEQRSPLHLRLLWVRKGSPHVQVLMERMPVANGKQVLPLYPYQAYEQARESLIPGRHGPWCRKMLDLLRSGRPGSSPPRRRNYSDIYVHV